jgi:hypothetical protein
MNRDTKTLLDEHSREIEATCCELRGETYADDPQELVAAYRRFEREMLDHLDIEEKMLLPGYAAYAPDDAHKLLEEHGELRQLLYRLAIDVELHTVRAQSVNKLVARLREHAAHEDEGLYTWAAAHLPAGTVTQLIERIRTSIAALTRTRSSAGRIAMQR